MNCSIVFCVFAKAHKHAVACPCIRFCEVFDLLSVFILFGLWGGDWVTAV